MQTKPQIKLFPARVYLHEVDKFELGIPSLAMESALTEIMTKSEWKHKKEMI